MNYIKILMGTGLVAFALIPTPDDVTVVVPMASLTAGIALITSGTDKRSK